MLRFLLELGLDRQAMATIPTGIILTATILTATTDHIITATMDRRTIGLAGIGTGVTTVITIIGTNKHTNLSDGSTDRFPDSIRRAESIGRCEQQRRENNEDTNNNSYIGVTADGTRPNGGTATGAGTDEGIANYCADQREKDASRTGADQATGKT